MLQTRQRDPDGRHRRLETTLDGRVDADQDDPTPPQCPLQRHVQKLDVQSVGASPGERGTFGREKYRIVRIATPNTNGLWNVRNVEYAQGCIRVSISRHIKRWPSREQSNGLRQLCRIA